MDEPGSSTVRRRGRPLDPRLEQALRHAVQDELAAHGWRAATIERIAARAGVARTTIYRRYGSLPHVLLLVMDDIYAQVPVADTGTLRGDILSIMRDIVAVWSNPAHVRYLAALIAAQHDNAAFAHAYQAQLQQRRAQTEIIVARAVKRGELPADTDRDLLLDLLDGIVLERVLVRRRPLGDDFPETLADHVLTGFNVRSATTT